MLDIKKIGRIFLLLIISIVGLNHTAQAARIISLKPNITDVLLRLDLGSELVGVTTYCTLPPALGEISRVADYIKPNPEKILRAHPDLILTSKENSDPREIARLRELGMRVELVSFSTWTESLDAIQKIGGWTGRSAAAIQLISDLNLRLERLRVRVERLDVSPRWVVIVGREPLVMASAHTPFGELFTRVGLLLVSQGDHRSTLAYPQLSKESLSVLSPDWIVDVADSVPNRERVVAFYRASVPMLEAVKKGHIAVLEGRLMLPGPSLLEGLERLLTLLEAELSK